MKHCIFCRILAGEQPSYPIYDDNEIQAILDIDPINEGHILILPKMHYSDADELPEALYLKIQILARKLVAVLKNVYGCDGYTVMQNGGRVSAIGHYHLHIFPRYMRDGFFVMTSGLSYRVNEKVAEKIKQQLNVMESESVSHIHPVSL